MPDAKAKFRIEGEDATAAAFRSVLASTKTTADKMGSMFSTVFAGLTVAGAGALALKVLETGHELETLARRASIGGAAMAQLSYVARQNGIDVDALSRSLGRMQVNLGSADQYGGKAADAIRALGFTTGDLLKLAPDRQFSALAEALGHVQNEAKQAQFTYAIFGRDAGFLLPLFKQGGEAINQLADEYKTFSGALTDESIQQLAETDKQWKALKESASALAETLMAKLGPSLSTVFNTMRSWMSDSKELDLRVKLASERGALATTLPAFRAEREQNIAALELQLNAMTAASDVAKFNKAIADRQERESNVTVVGKRWTPADERAYQAQIKHDQDEQIRQWRELDRWAAQTNKRLFDTSTASEQAQAEMHAFMDDLIDQQASGLITAEESVARFQEYWDRTMTRVETKSKRLPEFYSAAELKSREYGQATADALEQSFAGFFDGTIHGLDGLVKAFANAFEQILASAAAHGLLNMLFAGVPGGATGFFESFFSSVFGGSFAGGGDIPGGKMSIVGERGPELFIPRQSGTIVPNAGAGTVVLHSAPVFNIDSRSDRAQIANDTSRLLQQSNRELVAILKRYNPGIRV